MAFDAFIKIGNIRGEAMDHIHGGEIDVVDWHWGLSNSGTMHRPNGRHGKASLKDLSITKWVDRSTPILTQYCGSGKHIDTCVLTIRKSGGEALEFLTIEMNNVMVAEINTGDEQLSDHTFRTLKGLVLHFGKISMTYQPQKNDGSADGGAITFSHDIKRNITT